MKAIRLYIIFAIFSIVMACKRDPCESLICLNNGTCLNGECECPENYQGAFCEEQRTPKKIKIESVLITRFPAYNSGNNWDLEDGPDIYFQLFEGNILIYDSPSYYKNANPDHDYIFSPLEIQINSVESKHTIQIMDYDEGVSNDDFMGGILFTPYWSNTNGFPDSFELDAGGKVAFQLTVSYEW